MNIISNALVILVENSLYYLRTNFEQKKILLQFDINDAHLVKSFYDLNPTEEQIGTVQKIWRAKVKSCKRGIHQKKKHSNQSSSGRINDNQQDQLFPFESFIPPAMRTIIEARLINIEQRTQQLMNFIHTIDDTTFF
ncbi:unnamed protein product [Rotaria sordida]|uniref:Uncharacterized protein n=1 Tax=Rotaria sordida TaxID=392033 RepID=A0A819HTC6_9BILA|nr:unnamed protein product [Rotaria sordida]CAF3908594.1 unnamed protein product [Rotaria sordida]